MTKAKAKTKVKVIQKEDEPIATEVIAQAVVEISTGIKKIRAGRLNDKAIIFLVHKSTGVSQDKIKAVINGLESLAEEFLK